MIVDTSALVAVLKGEPEAAAFLAAMVDADTVRMSAGTYLETGIVVDRLGNPVLRRRLDDLFDAIGVRIEAVTLEQAKSARAAYRDFGKGSGRPAGLNLATASVMPWPSALKSLCCSRGMTSRRPTSPRPPRSSAPHCWACECDGLVPATSRLGS